MLHIGNVVSCLLAITSNVFAHPSISQRTTGSLLCSSTLMDDGLARGANTSITDSLLGFCKTTCQCPSVEMDKTGSPECNNESAIVLLGYSNSTMAQVCQASCICTSAAKNVVGASTPSKPPGTGAGVNGISDIDGLAVDSGDPAAQPVPRALIQDTEMVNITSTGVVCPHPGPVDKPGSTTGVANLYCLPSSTEVWIQIWSDANPFLANLCNPCVDGKGPDPTCIRQPNPLPGPCCRQNGACWFVDSGKRYGVAHAIQNIQNITVEDPIISHGFGPANLPQESNALDCKEQLSQNRTRLVSSFKEYQCALSAAQGTVY